MKHQWTFLSIAVAMIVLAGSTDNTVAQTKSATWTSLTFMNGWKKAVDSHVPAVMLDANGIVHLRGAVKNPSDDLSNLISQLPAPFRPTRTVLVPTVASQATFAAIIVAPSGLVNVVGGDPDKSRSFTSLEGVSFSK